MKPTAALLILGSTLTLTSCFSTLGSSSSQTVYSSPDPYYIGTTPPPPPPNPYPVDPIYVGSDNVYRPDMNYGPGWQQPDKPG